MKLLDLTLASPHANVALDEALLESSEHADFGDVLRFWEPAQPLVVIGRSSIVAQEVDLDYCRRNDIPIVRRCSGGAAIVAGPGCLMYALVLSLERWPQLELLDVAHRVVLQRMAAALQLLGVDARPEGTSDMAVRNRKISGNSLRRKRHWVLYHGTLLYGLSAELIERCLRTAPRQPEYRRGRTHTDFVTAIAAAPGDLKNALAQVWRAQEKLSSWPQSMVDRLVNERYSLDSWNFAR